MSLCPVCGRLYCDHTPDERGQTHEEMMHELSPEERQAFEEEPSDSARKIEVARAHAHDLTGEAPAEVRNHDKEERKNFK